MCVWGRCLLQYEQIYQHPMPVKGLYSAFRANTHRRTLHHHPPSSALLHLSLSTSHRLTPPPAYLHHLPFIFPLSSPHPLHFSQLSSRPTTSSPSSLHSAYMSRLHQERIARQGIFMSAPLHEGRRKVRGQVLARGVPRESSAIKCIKDTATFRAVQPAAPSGLHLIWQ